MIRFALPVRFLTCLIALAFASAAVAQQVPQRRLPSSTAPISSTAISVTSAGDNEVVEVPLNKARVISLPQSVSNIVVGNEAVADVHLNAANPNQVYVLARSIGSTNVFFSDSRGRIFHRIEVRVAANHTALEAALNKLLPNENIEVSVFRDSVFLVGNVRTASTAADAASIARRFVAEDANVTNMLKVAGSQQVILQVRVSEMDRAIRKNLSVDQKISLNSALGDIDVFTVSPATTLSAFGTGTLNHDIRGLGPSAIEALERQTLTKTLAEPTLTAISGQTAQFLSGGEIPVPTGVDQNGNALIEFREFGIRLEFTPVVQDKGRINLRVVTEISAPDSTNNVTVASLNVNGFTTKRAETTVDLPSGGTLMMAGLLQDDVTNSINGLPFLKDVPVLGALFRSTEFQRDETELVITVTAFLAKPTDHGRGLSVPTDGFEPASDIDIYLLGRLHRVYGEGERPFWKDPLKGPFGYIMR